MFETDSKRTPLLEFFESLGFNAEGNNGTGHIKIYNSVNDELHSLYEGVGMRDISNYGIFELRGNDVLDFIHRISTNSVKNLPKESAVCTIFTSEKGRIIDSTLLLNFEDHQVLISTPSNKMKVKSWIEKYVIMDDVKITNVNESFILLELLGPQAESFTAMIGGNAEREIEENQFKVISSDGMVFFLIKLKNEDGKYKFWILADVLNGKNIIKNFKDYNGPFDFNFIGTEAYELYRIEQGITSAPNELNGKFNPYETNLLNLVDFEKGCYIGQEVIARLDTYDKVQKKITGITIPEKLIEMPLLLYDEDSREVGVVTSLTYSEKIDKSIGLAMIRKNYLNDGTNLTAKSENGNSFQVTVHNLPFNR